MKRYILIILILAVVQNLYSENLNIKKCYSESYKFEKNQNYKDSIRVLLPIYKKYPKGYTIILRLAWLSYLNKKYSDAIKYYKKANKISIYSLEPKLGLTLVYLHIEKYIKVEEICGIILKTDYYNYYANLRLIYSLNYQKKYKDSYKIIIKMLTIYPTNVKLLVELGKNYYAQKQFEKAFKTFYDVLILDPVNVTAKSYLFK